MRKVLALGLVLFSTLAFGEQKYSCEEGKRKTCKTITSCEEAMFYLKQCGITRLDADRDGIPCECQACISKNPNADRCKEYR
ncbi:excalibur calcium-binding domain-containing protein [Hydrogenobacter hydrogenophilus]|uniref:Excalibur calcium-binding domain-containing protein n=1 Tax=Hydrogenobacter hydrogenophilus TaxID=35835 RepID=A0A285P0F4_9AQUI|nr:excalibur calcium-binding domain-containing protein [Hydrogenobacter hydrogenophilus]SNZ15210.1 Excalibur calcium-binding domain-containing protein [Hydrogenobacter hydrogenophilus]